MADTNQTIQNNSGLGWHQRHMLDFMKRHDARYMSWGQPPQRYSFCSTDAGKTERVALSLQKRGLAIVDTVTNQMRLVYPFDKGG